MNAYLGIDIQVARQTCYALIDDENLLESKWVKEPVNEIPAIVARLKESYDLSVGIDAPRQPRSWARTWYWEKNGNWRRKRSSELGHGRHCEVVIAAHRLANPQWTPFEKTAPAWMKTGFELFETLRNSVPLYEVFPTASYSLLAGVADVRISINFKDFRQGPKDMIDAIVAAVTVREFVNGRGTEVGGEDGHGTIILPRPLRAPIQEVLHWPVRDPRG